MKLNPDCVRDILLTVQDTSNFSLSTTYSKGCTNLLRLKSYPHDEIIYHIRQCTLSNLLSNANYYDNGDVIIIKDLTPLGHEFLSNIESKPRWEFIKKYASVIGTGTLKSIIQIATTITTEVLKTKLGI